MAKPGAVQQVQFTDVSHLAAQGCLVKPVFHQFIQDPNVKFEFSLKVARPTPRPYDGYFHASVHPLASDRALWMYLAHPERVEREPFGYAALMAVMFGSLGHAVIEAMLERMGVAVPLPPGPCPACGRPRRQVRAGASTSKYCSEHGAVDEATRARCHLDSIVHFAKAGTFGFDFKSIHHYGLRGIPDMDAEAFKEKWPNYWAQVQECMRLTGLRKYILFFLTMGTPWDTREFHIEFDPVFAAETEAKYRRVIECVNEGVELLG